MNQGYKVEDILKKKVENGTVFYRIKWKGYSTRCNTWEPAHHLSHDLVKYYEEKEEEMELRRQQKQEQQSFKSFYLQNQGHSIKILGHFLNGQRELVFQVYFERTGRKEDIERDKMINKYGFQLANYYVDLAKKTGQY